MTDKTLEPTSAPAAPKITDEDRKALKTELDAIDQKTMAITKEIDALVGPLRQQERELTAQRDALLERYGVEDHGECVSCEMPIFVGEQGYSYADGPITCAGCAPTWADIKRMAEEEPESWEDEETRNAVLAECREREAAGTLGEKSLHTF